MQPRRGTMYSYNILTVDSIMAYLYPNGGNQLTKEGNEISEYLKILIRQELNLYKVLPECFHHCLSTSENDKTESKYIRPELHERMIQLVMENKLHDAN